MIIMMNNDLFFRSIDFNESYPSVVFEEGYSKHLVPSVNEKPLTVNFSFNLVSIVAVDEPNQVGIWIFLI